MRVIFCLAIALVSIVAQPASAATGLSPFAVAAVGDAELADVRGAGRIGFRMTDELSATSLRQTATLIGTMRDLWLIDVASPLIAANVRAAGDR